MMRFILFLCLLGFISCKNENQPLLNNNQNTSNQIRLQFISDEGDTTYSEIKTLK